MVGFRGAVEDGIRNLALLIGLVAGGVTTYLARDYWIGLGAFAAVNLIGFVWASRAGASFTARQHLAPPPTDTDDDAR